MWLPNRARHATVSFQALDRTVEALERAVELEGMSPTDVVNRAVQLYAVYVEGRVAGHRLAEILPDGTVETLELH